MPVANCPVDDLPCATAQHYAAISDDPADVESLIMQTRESADRYVSRFGARPPATIVVTGGTVPQDLTDKLEANGYVILMPWVTAKQRLTLRADAVRSQVDAQTQGLPESVRQAAMDSALDQIVSAKIDGPIKSVLPHELGHKWFINQFSNAKTHPVQHAYGGWAPDWLDEAVAVSMETDSLKSRRRNFFKEASLEDRISLEALLEMQHPSADVARALAEKFRVKDQAETDPGVDTPFKALSEIPRGASAKTQSRVSRIITLSGEEGKQFVAASGGNRVLMFYSQALIFGEFLQVRTGQDSILAEIAATLFDGNDFKYWLDTNPYGLPETLDGLQADWEAYIGTELS